MRNLERPRYLSIAKLDRGQSARRWLEYHSRSERLQCSPSPSLPREGTQDNCHCTLPLVIAIDIRRRRTVRRIFVSLNGHAVRHVFPPLFRRALPSRERRFSRPLLFNSRREKSRSSAGFRRVLWFARSDLHKCLNETLSSAGQKSPITRRAEFRGSLSCGQRGPLGNRLAIQRKKQEDTSEIANYFPGDTAVVSRLLIGRELTSR